LAVTAWVQAAEYTKPNVKPGLWEISTNRQVSGDSPAIPADQLAKLTPEQRARVQAAMQASKGATKPHVYKECMTPEKIAHEFEMDPQGDDAACKRKVVSSSPSELTVHDECSKADNKTVTDLHFQIKDGTQMSGKINVVMTSAGKTMTVNSTVQGKWLAASCGSVKDSELEK
jgi:hypothetical protein